VNWDRRQGGHDDTPILIAMTILLILGIGTMAGLVWITNSLVQQVKRIDGESRQALERSTKTLRQCTEQLR
jgi:uncharacterized membrane protein